MKNTLLKDFGKFVTYNILGMIGLSCYILVDTFFVSLNMGSKGLTALNLAISIYSFINGIGLMIGIGGATRYSICKAKKEDNYANRIFTVSITVGIIIGIMLAILGFMMSYNLAGILGGRGEIQTLTSTYLKVLLGYSPFFIANNILVAFVRNDNNPKLSMAGMLIGSFSNIILDYVFMFIFGWGMFGAAFATGLAPVISICILSSHFIKKRNGFKLVSGFFSNILKDIRDIVNLGISAFVNELASGIVLIIFNLLILKICGDVGVAAYGIVANLALVAIAIFTGVSQGTQPLVSKYYGKGNQREVNTLLRYGIILASIIGLVIIIIGYACTNGLIGVFNSEHNVELSKIAFKGIRLYFLGFVPAGINVVMSGYLSAIERGKQAFTISIIRGCIGIMIFAFVLSYWFGMNGIWISFICAEGLTFIIGTICILNINNKAPIMQ